MTTTSLAENHPAPVVVGSEVLHHDLNGTTGGPTTALQSLVYHPGGDGVSPTLQVLDQLLIPAEKKYVEIPHVAAAWSVIRKMQIRGAPLIAIVACLGLAVDLTSEATTAELDALEQEHRSNPALSDEDKEKATADALLAYIHDKMEFLATSRPTAVNLFHALDEIKVLLRQVVDTHPSDTTGSSLRQRLVQAVLSQATFMLERDLQDNKNIGQHGADLILEQPKLKQDPNYKVTVMTICNTGSLATAGHGTALGVVRALRDRDRLAQIVALETRPYNQGSRLTAFEMVQEQMPGATLICDSMAAAFMNNHTVDAVVVGADRVCANGDTANKIGTYSLALCAAAHRVPFYVAAPWTTLDLSLASGRDIHIEERPSDELLSTSRAPPEVAVWNPAFDVTPAPLIAGIITERGVIHPAADGSLDVAAFDAAPTSSATPATPKLQVPASYTEQSVETLPWYLAHYAPAAMQVLQANRADQLECVEMGDGNLNLVFIVTNTEQRQCQVIVKQALPYVRCVGESWPLTLERSYFEYRALTVEKEACPEFVPTVYYFNKNDGLMVMQYLAPPNIILRKGLIQGIRYPTMAADMGTFCAKSLFKTSGLALSATQLRQQVQFWSTNVDMCALTEQVVFTEPYMTAPNNRWTSPQLDQDKLAIEQNGPLKIAAAHFKSKFVEQTQALIHGDLHSGSVMCSPAPGQTFVIDPEFAFYGPMGFDTGAFVANLFLAYVSQFGHDNGEDYAEWILDQIATFWNTFTTEFVQLWNDPAQHKGYLFSRETLKESGDDLPASQALFLQELLADTLGFAGLKMLRRIVGIAHVEDLESITDPDVRARCERHGLALAQILILSSHQTATAQAAPMTMAEAIQLARDKKPVVA